MTDSQPTIIAIETATECCSAALLAAGELRERSEVAPRRHGQLILGMVEALLAEAGISLTQVDLLAVGRGPGAFTGVRVATGVVQGLAFAVDRPVVPVSSLAALAQVVAERDRARAVVAAIDARMAEVYWGAFVLGDDGLMCLQGDEVVVAPGEAPIPKEGAWAGAGTGWATYGEILAPRLGDRLLVQLPDRYPQAGAVARLAVPAWIRGETMAAEEVLPVYLRNRVVRGPGA